MEFSIKEETAILENSKLPDLLGDLLDSVKMQYVIGEARYYHTWDHALATLSWVNWVNESVPAYAMAPFSRSDLCVAALYHDAVYTAQGSPGNEKASADLLEKQCHGKIAIERPRELIMLTAEHGKIEANDDRLCDASRLFLDCDIASFGEPRWDIFLATNDDIEAELLAHHEEDVVKEGRLKFLKMMLNKESIFLSDHFQVRYEVQARYNIRRLIRLLSD